MEEKRIEELDALQSDEGKEELSGTSDAENSMTEEAKEAAGEKTFKKGLAGYLERSPKRTNILHLAAGGYIAYMGYQLCAGFLAKAEGASVGFFITGLAFCVIGGFLAVLGCLGLIKKGNS